MRAKNDQMIKENILLTTKGASDLYMHGTIESSTQNVHQAFDKALNDTLCMQEEIYGKPMARIYPFDRLSWFGF